jgi:hypothetical protein
MLKKIRGDQIEQLVENGFLRMAISKELEKNTNYKRTAAVTTRISGKNYFTCFSYII